MEPLNFPPYQFRLRLNSEKREEIFDPCRKKWLFLTPEEWVRQNWLQHLVNAFKIPLSMITVEGGFKVVQRQKRFDVLVYKNTSPALLLECKSTSAPINQEVLDQILVYNRKYKSKFLVLSNGIQHKYFKVDYTNGKLTELLELPPYEDW